MKNVRATLTISFTRFDIMESGEAIREFYSYVLLEYATLCQKEVVIERVNLFEDSHEAVNIVLKFEEVEDMKFVCQKLLTNRKEFESKYPSILYDVAMTVNNVSENFSFNNNDLIYNCLNVLAKEQEKYNKKVLSLEEFVVCQSRLNSAIVPDQEKLKNILLGFNPETDKWN